MDCHALILAGGGLPQIADVFFNAGTAVVVLLDSSFQEAISSAICFSFCTCFQCFFDGTAALLLNHSRCMFLPACSRRWGATSHGQGGGVLFTKEGCYCDGDMLFFGVVVDCADVDTCRCQFSIWYNKDEPAGYFARFL